jgi:hypothetical protein
MTTQRLYGVPLFAISCAFFALPARAGILGDTIHVNYLFPDTSTIVISFPSQTVTAGGSLFDMGHDTLNVLPDMITLKNDDSDSHPFLPGAFNGFSIDDVTSPGKITGVTIDPSTNFAGFDTSRIFFSGTTLFVNFQGLTSFPRTYVQLDLTTSEAPEPSSAELILMGAAALALGRIRRRTGLRNSV